MASTLHSTHGVSEKSNISFPSSNNLTNTFIGSKPKNTSIDIYSNENELTKDGPLFLLRPCELRSEGDISENDINLLHRAHHPDPFSVLGVHMYKVNDDPLPRVAIRFWRKDVSNVSVRVIKNDSYTYSTDTLPWINATRRADWLYQVHFTVEPTSRTEKKEVTVSELLLTTRLLYEAEVQYHNSVQKYIIRDTYNFGILLSEADLQRFQTGSCWHVDDLMGSHIMKYEGVLGVRFAVWAPNAVFVSVVGDWNQWDGRAHPMRKRVEFCVWELFIPHIGSGEKYSFKIHCRNGTDVIKIDPYAQEFEVPPQTASIVSACDDAFKSENEKFKWSDDEWMQKRVKEAGVIARKPMSIYEVHLPSWMRGDGNRHLSYKELSHRLVTHLKNMNFTHVEFLPLAHHPFEGSWGYQTSGPYAPYSRLGNPDDLKYLINELHNQGIGVFVDFVLAHFVKDTWGLSCYDGEPCYEYADPREGEHKGWGTHVFNYRKSEVRSFLLGSAYHWLRRYHIDGLRIDAVTSMIYRNYGRLPGDWVPNEFGGDANLEAISLLQELNWVAHKEFPGIFMMAEESTSWQGITDREKGLGFDAKWDLGWMNDTLSYLCAPTPIRCDQHNKLTFRGFYMAHESWVLPLSHDEVVNGKGSLLDKCGFKDCPFQERLRTLRALYGFQVGMPGRPLLFMGGEFGQGREWKETRSLDWHEAEESDRKKTLFFVSDLMAIYRDNIALHAGDDDAWNFQWADCENSKDNLVAWSRKYDKWYNDILFVCNFSGNTYKRYPIGVSHGGEWKTLINSDDWKYGGSMHGPGRDVKVSTTVGGRLGWPYCLWLDIPGFGCLILKAPEPSAN